jgi:hypothetical protein
MVPSHLRRVIGVSGSLFTQHFIAVAQCTNDVEKYPLHV